MEFIPDNLLLKFNPNTLTDVRKEYGYNQKNTMNEAIDILEMWLQKQDHFIRKDFPRDYLERTIIFNKGSLERAKAKLDKLCLLRSTYPHFFDTSDIKERTMLSAIHDGILPQLTPNNERIYLLKCGAQKFEKSLLLHTKFLLNIVEYLQTHDYNRGFIVIIDYREVNVLELMKASNIVKLKQMISIVTEGYGMRIKGIHVLSNNKAIKVIIDILKQVLGAKIFGRLFIHKSLDALDSYLPRDILPVEYGGTEDSLKTIFENNFNVITSDVFLAYLKKMSEAGTNEEYRQRHELNPDIGGVVGTFRTLTID